MLEQDLLKLDLEIAETKRNLARMQVERGQFLAALLRDLAGRQYANSNEVSVTRPRALFCPQLKEGFPYSNGVFEVYKIEYQAEDDTLTWHAHYV